MNASAENVLTMPMAALQQGQQIARELAAKEREKNGGAAGKPAGMPSAPEGAAPGAAWPSRRSCRCRRRDSSRHALREGGAAPTPAAGTGASPATTGPTNAEGGARAIAPTDRGVTAPNGQGMRAGQPGGNFNGPRPGGAGGFQNMTAEEREAMIARMRAQGGGFNGGQRPGGFGQRGNNMAAAGATGAPRPAQRRNGTVMVKKADGTLEARRVVIGVTDRVHGEVIEGLKEGEEVVVGKREAEVANRPSTPNNNQQNNNQNRNNQGGFPGGGGGFPGGGRF